MNQISDLKPNKGKNLEIAVDGIAWQRLPIRTEVVKSGDDFGAIVSRYVKPHCQNGDMLFVSERVVAISEGRAYPIKDIKPSRLAKILVKFVHKSPYGIGLGSPWTMELAIREAGAARILWAAALSAITKPFGLKGVFYKAVGRNINAIDGPCSYTLPPFNEYAKLAPKDPVRSAREISRQLGCEVVIIDANDLGVAVLGTSSQTISDDFCRQVFRDNPLGQSDEQTPLCLVRRSR